MGKIIVSGGRKLSGEITVQGSKNGVLPILASTLTSEGQSIIENCPNLSDTTAACEILEHLGCKCAREGQTVIVTNKGSGVGDIPDGLMRKMRSSVMFLGAILARENYAQISFPGGCELGPRPIDLHISALKQMGVRIEEEAGLLRCTCPNGLRGANIHLSLPSVGATENVMLAAVRAKGETVINNAAREPEIVDLACFLNKMGARIHGAGEGVIRIEGVDKLQGAQHRVVSDRIVAVSYLLAACVSGGRLRVDGIDPAHIASVTGELEAMGISVETEKDSVTASVFGRPYAPRLIRTAFYPGFPTDAQALMMALASISSGSSLFIETIFQNRFRHVGELRRMGADIQVEQRVAVVEGVPRLWGAPVEATDLRGGAALLIAALAAQGETVIDKSEHIDRGYDAPEIVLGNLGAQIYREE